MSKILIDEAVVRQALDYLIAYEVKIDSEWGDCREMEQIDRDGDTPDIIIALRKVLSDAALDKMADNANELGLSYEQPAQQEPVIQDWMKPDALCDRSCLYACTEGFTKFPTCVPPTAPAQAQEAVPSIIQMLGHCPECGAKAHHFTKGGGV